MSEELTTNEPANGCATECVIRPEDKLPTVQPIHRVQREDDGYRLQVELPGVTREQIDLQVEKRRLVLTAERVLEAPEGYHARRRGLSDRRYQLSLQLGSDIDATALAARLENGLLEIVLPLAAQAGRRRITVN